ncbi:MAG: PKD domain-containing protein, partial [Anaerolineae bacterium]|nr:PKD domain-containing protein [Anaerolineae bacterium]
MSLKFIKDSTISKRISAAWRQDARTLATLLIFLLISFLLIFSIATFGVQRNDDKWLRVELLPQTGSDYGVDDVQQQPLARIAPEIIEAVKQDEVVDSITAATAVAVVEPSPTPTPTVTATVDRSLLVVDIGGPYDGDEGSEISLEATTPSLVGIAPGSVSYSWDLNDDGVFDDDAGASVFTIFPDDGLFSITVQAADLLGRVATDTTVVQVRNVAPVATLNVGDAVEEGTEFTVSATVDDPGNDILFFQWDFGEGFTTEFDTLTPQFTYFDNGDYPVRFRVEDLDGGVTETFAVVEVLNADPQADAGSDKTVDEGRTLVLNGQADDPAGDEDTLTYAWDFDFDGINFSPDATGPTVSVKFNDGPDQAVAALRVRDEDGGEDFDFLNIDVNNVAPTLIGITTSAPSTEGSSVTFDVSATDVGSDTLTYAFDWENDGTFDTTSLFPSTANIWPDDGLFTVRIGVDDGDGGEVFATTAISVTNVAPTAILNGPAGPIGEGITAA